MLQTHGSVGMVHAWGKIREKWFTKNSFFMGILVQLSVNECKIRPPQGKNFLILPVFYKFFLTKLAHVGNKFFRPILETRKSANPVNDAMHSPLTTKSTIKRWVLRITINGKQIKQVIEFHFSVLSCRAYWNSRS